MADERKFVKMLHWGILLVFVPTYSSADRDDGICVRDPDEVKKKMDYLIPMDTLTSAGREEAHYLTMVENNVIFADKSLLIKRILETNAKTLVINAPRLTGKSINLSMLKAFFEIRVKKNTPILYPRNQTSTYKFFTTGQLNTKTDSPLQCICSSWEEWTLEDLTISATYTKPPMIATHTDVIEEHLAKYPVIYLHFNQYGLNVTEHLTREICDLFKKHLFLRAMLEQASQRNSSSAGERFKNFLFYLQKCTTGELSDEDLENSVQSLSQILHEHFDKPVILLMDGYITSHLDYLFQTNYSWPRQHREQSVKAQVTLLTNFMRKSLTENSYLKKAVIMGTISAHRTQIFAHVSDIAYYNAVHNELQEFFGITAKEVEKLFRKFKIPSATRALHFYNGYTMKPNTDLVIYNSWSIANFVTAKEVKEYWQNHDGMFEELRNWLNVGKLGDVWKSLMSGEDVLISFTELNFDTKELLFTKEPEYSEKEVHCVLSLLYEIGFLTYSKHEGGEETAGIYVRATSEEMRHAFKKLLESLLN